jgi:hypothetical protein
MLLANKDDNVTKSSTSSLTLFYSPNTPTSNTYTKAPSYLDLGCIPKILRCSISEHEREAACVISFEVMFLFS